MFGDRWFNDFCFITESLKDQWMHVLQERESSVLQCLANAEKLSCVSVVSAGLVQAEILDWRLFRVSEQWFLKWFGKPCPIFELALRLNEAMPTSLPASVVYLQHPFNSPYSQNMNFLPFKYSKFHKYAAGKFSKALQMGATL